MIFFTGYPGFLGSALLPRVLERESGATAVCLVQPKFMDVARARLAEQTAAHTVLGGRVELVPGDITLSDLGLDADTRDRITAGTRAVYHLAAVYDVAVERGLATRVNVTGTRNVLDLAQTCPGLERVHYVSTCYVSGRYPGTFTEDQLMEHQTFNNYYEETKFLAEVDVQERMAHGLPATIYRPGIVVGDSRTGETQKFDGPYFFITFLLRQPGVAVMPVVGRPAETRANIVPRDFIIEAITHLSGLEASAGRVYQLADPDPPTVAELLGLLEARMDKRLVRVPVPTGVAQGAIRWVPGMRRLFGVPPEALDYFSHPTVYDTTNARRDLAAAGIEVPRFESYVDRLIDFVRAHPGIRADAMA